MVGDSSSGDLVIFAINLAVSCLVSLHINPSVIITVLRPENTIFVLKYGSYAWRQDKPAKMRFTDKKYS